MAYRFDHGWREERARLARIEQAFDPWTIRSVEETKPQPGWRCLEIGGGGGSIAEWLCGRVGPTGHVVATDLETKFLEAIEASNLQVRRHDVVTDPLEEGQYDLIHSRAVLEHLPDRDAIVPRLVGALRPGGWLTLESGDLSTVRMVGGKPADAEFFNEAFATMVEFSQTFGAEMSYGRRLGTALRSAGLERVVVEGYITEWRPDHPVASLYDLTFQRLRGPALRGGVISEADLNRLFSMLRSPELHALSHIVYAARGQRPAI
jgi:SAM-dependent methyltransferase